MIDERPEGETTDYADGADTEESSVRGIRAICGQDSEGLFMSAGMKTEEPQIAQMSRMIFRMGGGMHRITRRATKADVSSCLKCLPIRAQRPTCLS